MPNYGGVEAGGTKFVCVYGSSPKHITSETRFQTTTPQETLNQVINFFQNQANHGGLSAIGIGSFGPVDLSFNSPTFGYITTTPKPGWGQVDIVGEIYQALQVPIAFDTDVNAAAFGEWTWGAAKGLTQFIYLTIGTGIGGGIMVRGKPIHGLIHPEMGHIPLPHDLNADPFPGICPYHGDCFEGLASGPAMKARWGTPAEALPPDHPGWDLEANYIAYAFANFICTLSPERIILGGGVMQQEELFPKIRRRTQDLLNGYIQSPQIINNIDTYIVHPGLGTRSGVLGAMALAAHIAENPERKEGEHNGRR